MNIFALVLNSLWQAAALAVVAWLILRVSPRLNHATRYAIWWAVLGIVLLLPFAPSVRPLPKPVPAVVASTGGAPVNPLLPDAQIPALVTLTPKPASRWPLAIAAVWGVGFLCGLLRIVLSWVRLRGIKSRAIRSAESLPTASRRVRLLLSQEVSSPIAVGFLRPAVILPESLPDELSRSELDHVLLHESAHLVRFDDWQNLAARILEAAAGLHPVALWILRQIEREREFACDEWVVARTGEAHGYATSLARMYERRWSTEQVLAAGIFGRSSITFRRIEALLKTGRGASARVSAGRIASSCAVLLLLAAGSSYVPRWIAYAQQTPRPSFEVASVKPGEPGRRFGVGFRGSQFVATNAPLKIMIGLAYDVQYHQILGGPKWLDSDRFTIDARPDVLAKVNHADLRLMVQSLLEERFHLVLHRDTRVEPVYELVLARGGPKMKISAGPDEHGRRGIFGDGSDRVVANDLPIPELVSFLSQRLDFPVVNKTGLSGNYDFTLKFAPEMSQSDLALFGPADAPPQDPGLPSIFTALPEQLGLRLQSARGPVDVLVIDRAEKPDAN